MKKILSFVLVLAMVFCLAIPALAEEGIMPISDEVAVENGKIVILHTNDVHCGIDQATKDGVVTGIGYAGVAAYKAQMEAQYGAENVTLVDAGDAIQGGPIGTLTKGSAIVEIMNKVGYDLAIPGNHEFDYGMDNFLSLAKEKAEYSYICANFTDLDGKATFDAYKVLTYGDVKVAYVGIDTPETFTKSTPTYFQNEAGEYIYSFQQGNEGADLYAAVQKAVDAAKAEGADYVIALGHLGQEGSTDVWTSKAVAENTTGIDVLIDGHSHEAFTQEATNKDGKKVIIEQTGTKLANLGKIVIDMATGEITNELIPAAEITTQDENVAAFVKEKNDAFEEELKKVVAKSEVELTINDANGKRLVRSGETNLGDLCADAYRVMLGADVAFVNGDGVRDVIAAGDVTYENIIKVHPFGNEACLVETTGQDILDALEFGARNYPNENGGFLQVSGLTYTIDASIPSSATTNDENEFTGVDGAYRVSNVMVGDEPLDVNKTYTLASHNYMLKNGGDGFVMFKDDKLIKDCVMIDNAVLINYIVDELSGTVTAEQYAAPQGRINIKYVGVEAGSWYAAAAKNVIDKGLMTSTGTGFDPTANVTRATVFQTLYNLEGKPEVNNKMVSFPDAQGKWYENAARWAEQMELTTGTGNGFEGDREVTRAELVTVLARYAEKKDQKATEEANLLSYADGELLVDWAIPGFQWAVSTKVVSGKTGNLLAPNDTATRAELAQILTNYTDFFTPAA